MTVDLTLAKLQLRVSDTSEDTLISQYIAAAIAVVENYTGKKLTSGAVVQEFTAFGSYLALRWGPSPSALTITYTDADSVSQNITDALIVGSRAYPASSWPSILTNSVISAAYTAGYSTVPADLDNAVLLLVGEYFENREAGVAAPAVVQSAEALCRPYRSLDV